MAGGGGGRRGGEGRAQAPAARSLWAWEPCTNLDTGEGRAFVSGQPPPRPSGSASNTHSPNQESRDPRLITD